jgi:hypothetical protein
VTRGRYANASDAIFSFASLYRRESAFIGGLLIAVAATFSAVANAQEPPALQRLLDRIVKQEQAFLMQLKNRTPLIETYIQETLDGHDPPSSGQRDHYFLGRLDFSSTLAYTPIVARSDAQKRSRNWRLRKTGVAFDPKGFAQMVFIDSTSFNTSTYRFEYVRREFLGDVRCLVFDVTPIEKKTAGKFIGRMWVEDRDMNVVRFNGTYTKARGSDLYFHFDSWRVDVGEGRWMPAFSYIEESGEDEKNSAIFKAQTRIWGYNSGQTARFGELTTLLVEMEAPVKQADASSDASPLESQRSWERQAEENVIDRLEKSGLIAPKGPVDAVLDTVVNNLIATNGLNVETRCRVLLTTPLETFNVGRTIVISRGLIDVLPDEASLAMVLSDELAHVALAHRTNTQFAFHDETMFSDGDLLEHFRFARSPDEIASAGKKAVEILRNSPYKEKLSNAGLFLKELASRAPSFPNLIRANLGNRLADGSTLVRMGSLTAEAPRLEEQKLEQIAALPLGSRIKLDPWTDIIALIKANPIALLSAREKLSFEIAPLSPHLTRLAESPSVASPAVPSMDK